MLKSTNLFSNIFILSISIVIISCAGATRFSMEPGEGVYEYVEEHNKSKAEAHSLAMEWIATHYVGALDVVQMDDKDQGIIVVKGSLEATVSITKIPFYYIMKIRNKDNKVKFEFTTEKSVTNNAYPPKESMPELEAQYIAIKGNILAKINSVEDDF